MKSKTILVLVLIALLAILLVQNSGSERIRFYLWWIEAPMFVLVFFSFLLGFALGFLVPRLEKRRDKKGESASPKP
ncbi:MAG: LapA family protein [Candidatus Aminicenantales bacterium]|jgi:uncharacterized integral membrane protein